MKTKIFIILLFLFILTIIASCSSHEETNALINPPFLNEEMCDEVSE